MTFDIGRYDQQTNEKKKNYKKMMQYLTENSIENSWFIKSENNKHLHK